MKKQRRNSRTKIVSFDIKKKISREKIILKLLILQMPEVEEGYRIIGAGNLQYISKTIFSDIYKELN